MHNGNSSLHRKGTAEHRSNKFVASELEALCHEVFYLTQQETKGNVTATNLFLTILLQNQSHARSESPQLRLQHPL